MDHASMEMVNAVGMVILRVPAWPPVMKPPVMLPKPRLGGPLSYSIIERTIRLCLHSPFLPFAASQPSPYTDTSGSENTP